jgi:hypothetical protein
MRVSIALAALLVVASFAGCIGGDEAAEDVEQTSTEQTAANESANESTGASDEPTLDEPPSWSVGDWWTVDVTVSNVGETFSTTRVVAEEASGNYRVGMPVSGFQDPIVLAHFPGFGNVNPTDLGFSVHGEPFKPLVFPLEPGKAWTTTLYEAKYEAEVLDTDETTASIGFSSENGGDVNLTYDAEAGAITEFTGPLGTEFSVTASGENYEGEVKAPHDRDQFSDGRILGAFDFTLSPAPPTGSLSVGESFDEASVALIVGSAQAFGTTPPGGYQETANAPGGETFEAQTFGELTSQVDRTTEPSGEWTFEHVAGGFGAAATEIIAYQTQVTDPATATS